MAAMDLLLSAAAMMKGSFESTYSTSPGSPGSRNSTWDDYIRTSSRKFGLPAHTPHNVKYSYSNNARKVDLCPNILRMSVIRKENSTSSVK